MDQIIINLNDILRLVFPSEHITWLTDRKNLDIQTDWLSINVDHVQAGDLLILPSEKASKKNIRSAVENGVGAILIIGKPSNLNNNYHQNVPTLAIETSKSFRHIHREITQMLTSKTSIIKKRAFPRSLLRKRSNIER